MRREMKYYQISPGATDYEPPPNAIKKNDDDYDDDDDYDNIILSLI